MHEHIELVKLKACNCFVCFWLLAVIIFDTCEHPSQQQAQFFDLLSRNVKMASQVPRQFTHSAGKGQQAFPWELWFMLNEKFSTFSFISAQPVIYSTNPREKQSPFNRMLHFVAVCYCAGSVSFDRACLLEDSCQCIWELCWLAPGEWTKIVA